MASMRTCICTCGSSSHGGCLVDSSHRGMTTNKHQKRLQAISIHDIVRLLINGS
ncbi:hypothetical protein DAI22_12g115600 [Oryza sativa Japonica Group]|nr:hypothetical protein DAI22_12g115600 [Oryza sativa Japonica Group]